MSHNVYWQRHDSNPNRISTDPIPSRSKTVTLCFHLTATIPPTTAPVFYESVHKIKDAFYGGDLTVPQELSGLQYNTNNYWRRMKLSLKKKQHPIRMLLYEKWNFSNKRCWRLFFFLHFLIKEREQLCQKLTNTNDVPDSLNVA